MRFLGILVSVLLMVALAQPAEARRRGSTAEEIELVKDLPDTPEYQIEGQNIDVGFMYETTGIFFVPVWAEAHDEGFVLFGKQADGELAYLPLGETEKAALTKQLGSDPTTGYTFSRWGKMWGAYPIALLILFGLFSYVKDFFGKGEDEDDTPAA